jgi:hypothetical protein
MCLVLRLNFDYTLEKVFPGIKCIFVKKTAINFGYPHGRNFGDLNGKRG